MSDLDFDELFRAFNGRMLNYAVGLLTDVDTAEDATQEAWSRAWVARDSYEHRGKSPLGWLTTLTRFAAWDEVALRKLGDGRTTARHPVPHEGISDGWLNCEAVDHGTGLPGLMDPVAIMAIDEALRWVTPREHQILDLVHIQGRPVAEVAELLGIEPHSVRSHSSRGLIKVRKLFDDCGVHGLAAANLLRARRLKEMK